MGEFAYQWRFSEFAPYQEIGENFATVAFRHNPPTIDSPIFRWTIGGMRIPNTIKNADLSDGIDHNPLSDKEC
jgi:hypothetical protein